MPAGTFNHFAADLGVGSADDALAALRDGDSVLVDVATADGAAFLNTASTGVYVDLVKAREEIEPALGKWPAMLVALADVLRTSKPVDLLVNGRRRRVWLLFAGNCRYEPSGAAPAYRPDLRRRDARRADGRRHTAAGTGRGSSPRCCSARSAGRRVYRTWPATALRIASPAAEPVPLCLDGEATETKPAIRLVKRPKRLLVYRPRQVTDRRGRRVQDQRRTGGSNVYRQVPRIRALPRLGPHAGRSRPARRPTAAVHGLAGPGRPGRPRASCTS